MLLSDRRSRAAATFARWWTAAGIRSVTRTSDPAFSLGLIVSTWH